MRGQENRSFDEEATGSCKAIHDIISSLGMHAHWEESAASRCWHSGGAS